MFDGMSDVRAFRDRHGDAYYFNWRLTIDRQFQLPFVATHQSMRDLRIGDDMPKHDLAVNLRRAFSGIVSGNVREDTAALIEAQGPFEIRGAGTYMRLLDELLAGFVEQNRMKLSMRDYAPCYRVS